MNAEDIGFFSEPKQVPDREKTVGDFTKGATVRLSKKGRDYGLQMKRPRRRAIVDRIGRMYVWVIWEGNTKGQPMLPSLIEAVND